MNFYCILIFIVIVLLLYILCLYKKQSFFIKQKESLKKEFQNEQIVEELLWKKIHAYVIYIDRGFRVLKTNYYDLTNTQKIKDKDVIVGNLLHCQKALDSGECGTHDLCASCPIRKTINQCFEAKSSFNDVEAVVNMYTSEDRNSKIDCSVLLSGSYLKIDNEDRMLLTIYNISAQKEIQKELKEAKEKAEEVNELKNKFLTNISHEIRTPLNAIIGFSNIMVDMDNREEREEYNNIIRQNNNTLLNLFDDILDLSYLESSKTIFNKRPININDIINEFFLSAQEETHNKGIKISREVAFDECIINLPLDRINKIISNFLDNAIKFTSQGSITIGYNYLKEEKAIYIYVKDTGCGIPEDKQLLIFDKFTKLNEFVPGTGLGLFLCKTIVEQMNGKIGVHSKEGKGCELWFTLPITEKELINLNPAIHV